MNRAHDEMVEGYLDGFKDTRAELPAQSNYSEAYCHGWRNGRDDRVKKPRASYEVLLNHADFLIRSAEERQ